jgi:hypothetical protein
MARNLANQLFACGQIHRLSRKRPSSKDQKNAGRGKKNLRMHGRTLTKTPPVALQQLITFYCPY